MGAKFEFEVDVEGTGDMTVEQREIVVGDKRTI
jgi:hypothetical protein